MLPVGDDDDTVLVMNEVLRHGRHCFEALRRVPGGDSWRVDAIPDPPIARMGDDGDEEEDFYYPCVTAYFARGSRAWITVSDVGTFSLDMLDRGGGASWQLEGRWELPLRDRGLFVPELGMVVGVESRGGNDEKRCCEVCAVDVEARPPAKVPPERVEDVAPWETVSLGHLGNGRFCIARSIVVKVPTDDDGCLLCEARGTSFTLVDVRRRSPRGELELATNGGKY
nr:unnamed protein product [Digitaria exilis]